jgi:hypothetical protein
VVLGRHPEAQSVKPEPRGMFNGGFTFAPQSSPRAGRWDAGLGAAGSLQGTSRAPAKHEGTDRWSIILEIGCRRGADRRGCGTRRPRPRPGIAMPGARASSAGVGAVIGSALSPASLCRTATATARPIIRVPPPMARRPGRPTGMPIAPRVTRASIRAPAISSASTATPTSAGNLPASRRPY